MSYNTRTASRWLFYAPCSNQVPKRQGYLLQIQVPKRLILTAYPPIIGAKGRLAVPIHERFGWGRRGSSCCSGGTGPKYPTQHARTSIQTLQQTGLSWTRDTSLLTGTHAQRLTYSHTDWHAPSERRRCSIPRRGTRLGTELAHLLGYGCAR